jgi:hypothetical protein
VEAIHGFRTKIIVALAFAAKFARRKKILIEMKRMREHITLDMIYERRCLEGVPIV